MEQIKKFAEGCDVSDVARLWDECFSQFGEYRSFFLNRIFKPECARLYKIHGETAGMIHVFPRTFYLGKESFSAKYIFAVGTTEKFRGRGVAEKLLSSEAEGCDFLTLIPQSESLFGFYKKKGFPVITQIGEQTVEPAGKANLRPAIKADIPLLNKMYRKMCEGYLYAERDESIWETLIAEYEFSGGGFAVFDGGYLAYTETEDVVYVDEIYSQNLSLKAVAGFFGKKCRMRSVGNDNDIAVIMPLSKKGRALFENGCSCYINLMHN